MASENELTVQDLRCDCDHKLFKFKSTAHIDPLDRVIGQERAVRAIEFGLDMQSHGYNIFVTGVEGTGKSSIVRELVKRHAERLPLPCDWCLVNNFKDNFRPIAVAVPPGKAGVFQKQMARVISDLEIELPRAFAADAYRERARALEEKYSRRQQRLFKRLEKVAAAKGLQINRTQAGFQTIPLADGQPMSQEMFQGLAASARRQIEDGIRSVQADIEDTIRKSAALRQALQTDADKLAAEVARFVVRGRIDILREHYRKWNGMIEFFDQVEADMIENVGRFLPPVDSDRENTAPNGHRAADGFNIYQVNVLVDRSASRGAPVIFETNPTYQNVFGKIEKRVHRGMLSTDFTMVQAGSLLNANGGFLLLEMASVLASPYVWEALKRALRNKLLHIEDATAGTGFGSASLRPEPLPLDVKVILVGSYGLFQELQNSDPGFNKIFRVRADFDDQVVRNAETLDSYARFVARVCREENLLPLTPHGVAAVVEFSQKQVADKERLSLRLGPVLGLLKEADYWARRKKARSVGEKHVRRALAEHRFRYNLYEEKMQQAYVDGTLMVDVSGSAVGQVNALAVYQIGDFSFGRPARITAETFMGQKGVINIERESKLSGKTHDKGVLILSGYLGRVFAQHMPLSLSISITFEQSYGGIDGDSASSTELYAILSSLSGIPIYQGIAVTGSVNQKGQIQAIGGVNQKIEGFFDVCRAKGLNGRQGVVIPRANVRNLALKGELVRAVNRRRFHVYAVSTVQEGIEILTNAAAGTPGPSGEYPPESIFGRAQAKIRGYLRRSLQLKAEIKALSEETVTERGCTCR